ncbi:hypothetical protein R3P38DRAFT_3438744 [Favolaschia claudopus]|uniref:Uncharacterized protein n=1 Tax=Favolaschia claudopus TaxID=2862362 RepID=A0AAV9ZRG4_9AGAR
MDCLCDVWTALNSGMHKRTNGVLVVRATKRHIATVPLIVSSRNDDEETHESSRSSSPEPMDDTTTPDLRALTPDDDEMLPSNQLLGSTAGQSRTSDSQTEVQPLSVPRSLESEDRGPLPDRVSEVPSTESVAGGVDFDSGAQATNDDVLSTRRPRRTVLKRRKPVDSDDEAAPEEGCFVADCDINGNEPMVECIGPACKNKVFKTSQRNGTAMKIVVLMQVGGLEKGGVVVKVVVEHCIESVTFVYECILKREWLWTGIELAFGDKLPH